MMPMLLNENRAAAMIASRSLPTVPLWLGCALLCTILVGIIGMSPFLAQHSANDIIVSEARNAYNTVLTITGGILYQKYVNELITTILANGGSLWRPQLTALNFSDPNWDREWQLFFSGVSVTAPKRRFYYTNLATHTFTSYQSNENGENFRVVGSADTVDFVGYRRNVDPPYQFQAVSNVSLRFPPMFLVNDFLAGKYTAGSIAPTLDANGDMVYGFAMFIFSRFLTSPTTPVGVLLELIPLEEITNVVGARTAQVARFSGDSIILDGTGALVSCTFPALTNIYVPFGTPGAICTTVDYANTTTRKCRHSLETIRRVWPVASAAHAAFLQKNAEGEQIVNQGINVSYVTFYVDGEEYYVSASSPPPSFFGEGAWAAAITPIAPIYGPYIANRNRIVVIVSCVCGGIALFTLVLTFVLMRPLGALMEEMIAALRLQTQTDRHVVSNALPSALSSDTACGFFSSRWQVSELHEVRLAVDQLRVLLSDVAKMLPPPVIQMIRHSLAQRRGSVTDADNIIGNSLTSSDEHTTIKTHASLPNDHKAEDAPAEENIEHTLAWFEDFNRAADSSLGGMFPLDERNASMQNHMIERSEHVHDSPSLNTQLPPDTNVVTVGNIEPHHRAADVQSTTTSILVNPKVSLLPPRRRGYFMAVSLPLLNDPAKEFSSSVAPLLSCVWRYRGEVELIERSVLLPSFGCYESDEDAPNRVLECGLAIVDVRGCVDLRIQCSIAIDCGWFETSTLSYVLPDGRLMRRQVVLSVARVVAVRMLSLGEVLNERLLITGDALRCVSAFSLGGRVPVVLDHLKFESLITRRRFVYVFSIPSPSSASTSGSRPSEKRVYTARTKLLVASDGAPTPHKGAPLGSAHRTFFKTASVKSFLEEDDHPLCGICKRIAPIFECRQCESVLSWRANGVWNLRLRMISADNHHDMRRGFFLLLFVCLFVWFLAAR
ncbi:GPI-anchored surface protein, putative [Bodo saltans]|uniref:GPI-anchored surface protein, putative n=1 Tax=Bodo saltans TaxID=75058 RepID=A0A0S4JV95_BODSA|nr:GPI-anchored surface protein, putative [Bodo saltans]|eukprot:CUG93967.1 GPI-anchored surface protein, putative [Bodo saltans]